MPTFGPSSPPPLLVRSNFLGAGETSWSSEALPSVSQNHSDRWEHTRNVIRGQASSDDHFDQAFDALTRERLARPYSSEQSPQPQTTFTHQQSPPLLPPEILTEIFSCLEHRKDILAASSTCQDMRFSTLKRHTRVINELAGRLAVACAEKDAFFFFSPASASRRDMALSPFQLFLFHHCTSLSFESFSSQLFRLVSLLSSGQLNHDPTSNNFLRNALLINASSITDRLCSVQHLQQRIGFWLKTLLAHCFHLEHLSLAGWPIGSELSHILGSHQTLKYLDLRNVWSIASEPPHSANRLSFSPRIRTDHHWRPILPRLEGIDLTGTMLDAHSAENWDLFQTNLRTLKISPLSLNLEGFGFVLEKARNLAQLQWKQERDFCPPEFLLAPLSKQITTLKLTRAAIFGVFWGNLFCANKNFASLTLFECQLTPPRIFAGIIPRIDVFEKLEIVSCELNNNFFLSFPWVYLSAKRIDLSGHVLGDHLGSIRFNKGLKEFEARDCAVTSAVSLFSLRDTRLKKLNLALSHSSHAKEPLRLDGLDLSELESIDISGQHVDDTLLITLASRAPRLTHLALRRLHPDTSMIAALGVLSKSLTSLDLSGHQMNQVLMTHLFRALTGRYFEEIRFGRLCETDDEQRFGDTVALAVIHARIKCGLLDLRNCGITAQGRNALQSEKIAQTILS